MIQEVKHNNGVKMNSKVYVWECLNCNKEYNSDNKIVKSLKRCIGLINSVVLCPFCKHINYDSEKHISYAKLLRVEEGVRK